MIKKKSLVSEFKSIDLTLVAPRANYTLNKENLESPYIVRNDGIEFYLVEAFFNDFQALKQKSEELLHLNLGEATT